jgi:hypothetical protein
VDSKRGNDLPFFYFWRRGHLCVNYEYTFVCLGCVYPFTLIALSVRASTLSQSSPRYYAFHEPALLVCITKTHAHIYVPNQRLPRNTRYSTCKCSVDQVYLRGQHRARVEETIHSLREWKEFVFGLSFCISSFFNIISLLLHMCRPHGLTLILSGHRE